MVCFKVNETDFKKCSEEDIRSRFPSSFTNIPDAQAVYEARKKREKMRHDGVGNTEFIPLDDTIRLKKNNGNRSGERSRLIREDENDMSDEDMSIDSGGKYVYYCFYKNILGFIRPNLYL